VVITRILFAFKREVTRLDEGVEIIDHASEDQVVAEFDLREEQPVPATCFLTLSCGEKRCEVCQPLLTASQQISRNERVGECLQAIRCGAFEEGVSYLLESDPALAQAIGEPMVLVEADAGRERKVGAHAHEHSPPVPIIDVKVVLNDPAVSDLKMPSVCDLVANGNHDARWLARFEDDYHRIWPGTLEIWIDEFVTTTIRCVDDRDIALGRSFLHPLLKFVSDAAQSVATPGTADDTY